MAKDHKYWVYIVASLSGTLYIGVTSNLFIRILQHKAGEVEGFSSQYQCNRLIYHESFDNVKKAIARETQLKGWRRSKKIALIEKMNPRWQDLAEYWEKECCFGVRAWRKLPDAAMAIEISSGFLVVPSTTLGISPAGSYARNPAQPRLRAYKLERDEMFRGAPLRMTDFNY